MGGRVEIRGLDNVIKNMQSLTPRIMALTEEQMNISGDALLKGVQEFAKLEDHSLKELAEMGHPYAWGEGASVSIGDRSQRTQTTDTAPHPDEYVHQQSHNLFDNIEKVVKRNGNRFIIACGVDRVKVPYVSYLINGTSKMRPRDFLGHAWKKYGQTIINQVIAGIRSKGSRGGAVGNRSSKVA